MKEGKLMPLIKRENDIYDNHRHSTKNNSEIPSNLVYNDLIYDSQDYSS
jgi:hypothetical protein